MQPGIEIRKARQSDAADEGEGTTDDEEAGHQEFDHEAILQSMISPPARYLASATVLTKPMRAMSSAPV